MALTYGFYDSLNHDRVYSANQMSTIFNGIITDGVFQNIGEHFSVVAGTGMQVIVKPGRAWFDGTWTLLDTDYALSINASNALLSRIDAVVLETNFDVETRANSIKVVAGTPSTTPVAPTLESGDLVNQHVLAYVNVAAGATAITNSMIDIQVGVNKETPYITSVLQQTNITELYLKWEDEWYDWFNNVKTTLSGDVAANLQANIDALENKVTNITDLTVWDQTVVTNVGSTNITFVDDGTVADYFGITSGTTYFGHSASDMVVCIPVCCLTSSSKRACPLYTISTDTTVIPLYDPLGVARASVEYVIDMCDDTVTGYDTYSLKDKILAEYSLYSGSPQSYTYRVSNLAGFYNGQSPKYFYVPGDYNMTDVFVRSGSSSYFAYYMPYTTSAYASNKPYIIWLNEMCREFVEADLDGLAYYTLCFNVRADRVHVGHYEFGSYTTDAKHTTLTSFNPNEYQEIYPSGSSYELETISSGTCIAACNGSSSAYSPPTDKCMRIVGGNGIGVTETGKTYMLSVVNDYLIAPNQSSIDAAIAALRTAGCEYIQLVFTAEFAASYDTYRGYDMFMLTSDFSIDWEYNDIELVNGRIYGNTYSIINTAQHVKGIGNIEGVTRIKRGKLSNYGNIQYGSYYGTSTYGSEAPCTIAFAYRPKTFMILGFFTYTNDGVYGTSSNNDARPLVPLETCPNEYTIGCGPSASYMTGSYGKYDPENNVYMWFSDSDFDQYNSSAVAYSSSVVPYATVYYWVAFG